MENPQNHPLHGLKLDMLLGQLVEQYGWEILAEQININCFRSYPSIESSLKFLRKTKWAREKLEAFYLYRFLNLPLPDEKQHQLPPRERDVGVSDTPASPAVIQLGEREFFDDPVTGPVFPSKKTVQASRSKAKSVRNEPDTTSRRQQGRSVATKNRLVSDGPTPDPWAKWREKDGEDE